MAVDQTKPDRTWGGRIKALFTQPVKLPGWAAVLLFIYTIVPDTYSRTEFWIATAKTTGGYVAMAALVVGSPYFGPGLLAFGLLWILFVGEPSKGVQRHHGLRYIGWSVFSVCLAAVAISAVTGWFELKQREAYASGAAGIPRNTPDTNNPNRPQTPFHNENWGLTPDQLRILLTEFSNLKPYVKIVWLSYASTDNQASAYVGPLQQLLDRSGLSFGTFYESPRDISEEGLMLSVPDINNLSVGAQKIREAFAVANIRLRLITLPENLRSPDRDFAIFIGPRPIKWR
jgi:hypothetical protein